MKTKVAKKLGEQQGPPLRYAPVGMNKDSPSTLLLYGRIDVKVCVSHISQKQRDMGHPLICGRERSQRRSVHAILNLPMARWLLGMTISFGSAFSYPNKFVIPTGAYPDFLVYLRFLKLPGRNALRLPG